MEKTEVLISQIQALLQGNTLTELERERLANELNNVHTRLKTGDYQRFSYTTNTFDVPNRTQDFFTELEFYCLLGTTWAQLLGVLDSNRFAHVVDLCPGYTPKIELGLFYTDFSGEVTILDNDSKSTQQLQKFMALFNPEFTISSRIVDLFEAFEGSYELVLGNHIIDDLVLYHFSKKQGVQLADLYNSEDQMKQLWQHITESFDAHIAEIVPLIADIFMRIVSSGGYVCLSQYPSYMERMLGIADAPKFSRQVLGQVVERLQGQGFVSQPDKVTQALADNKGHFGPDDCYILQRTK